MSLEKREKPKFKLFFYFFFPFVFVLMLWLIKVVEVSIDADLGRFGIYPRTWKGLQGILFYPLIHGSLNHLINNSTALLVLGMGIFHFYRPLAYKIFLWTYIISGICVWLSARPAYHIGASGLIYGFASFIFISGIIRKNTNLLALSMLVIFLYGGMVWGIFPIKPGMSWEGHLWGSIAGVVLAFYFRDQGPTNKRYSWEIEEEEEIENRRENDGQNNINSTGGPTWNN